MCWFAVPAFYSMLTLVFVLFCVIFVSIKASRADSLPNKLPYCSPTNLNLSYALNGKWLLLPDGSFRCEFSHCRLRRFRVHQVQRCFRGAHLVFMGDSLARYFYLSLANFLAKQKWSAKWARLPAHPTEKNHILSERDYGSWNKFYYDTNRAMLTGLDTIPYKPSSRKNKPSSREARRLSGDASLSSARNTSMVARRRRVTVEMCDCFRDDTKKWYDDKGTHQQTSCIENRHFRLLPKGDFDDREDDVRLSYIQWYGYMPIRGHKKLSTALPRDSSYFSYLQQQSKEICGDDLPTNYTLEGDSAGNRAVPLLVGGKMIPVDPYCSRKRALDESKDFPEFAQPPDCTGYPDKELAKCRKFEREILGPMGATHLLMNIGWHSGLKEEADKSGQKGMGKYFLQKVADGAADYFAPYNPAPRNNSDMERYHRSSRHVASAAAAPIGPYTLSRRNLPKVTWRSTTCCGPFHEGDGVAEKYHKASLKEHAAKHGDSNYGTASDRRLGFFEVWDLTDRLWGIHRKVKEKDYKGLLETVEKHWSWASLVRRNKDLYRHVETSDGKFNASIIQTTWCDPAHPEPWVYAEVHNVFFNAVCEV